MNQSNRNTHNVDESGPGAVAVDNDAPPKIYKLNIDCFDLIFDYLSWRDIGAMGATCKVMLQVAGHYFQQHFHDEVKYVNTRDDNTSSVGFSQFYSKLRIISPVQKILKAEKFSSLRELRLMGFHFDLTQLSHVKDILSNIEVLDLHTIDIYSHITDESYTKTLNYCTKLKCLRIQFNSLHKIEITQNWLRKNSTLERLGLKLIYDQTPANFSARYNKLISLVEQNPNVKISIEIRATLFRDNGDSFAESNIQVDCLSIDYSTHPGDRQIFDLLIRLNERGFYKKLNLDYAEWSQKFVNQIAPIKGLQNLRMTNSSLGVDLSPLVRLQDLTFLEINGNTNVHMDTFIKNLVNLKKLFIYGASTDDIIPFLRHSQKLNEVRGYFVNGDLIENDILDLAALNEQRQKLDGARKVSIFVDEQVYLATKWATKYWNLNLIEIKRYSFSGR